MERAGGPLVSQYAHRRTSYWVPAEDARELGFFGECDQRAGLDTPLNWELEARAELLEDRVAVSRSQGGLYQRSIERLARRLDLPQFKDSKHSKIDNYLLFIKLWGFRQGNGASRRPEPLEVFGLLNQPSELYERDGTGPVRPIGEDPVQGHPLQGWNTWRQFANAVSSQWERLLAGDPGVDPPSDTP